MTATRPGDTADGGRRGMLARLAEGAIAALRSPVVMLVVVGPSLVILALTLAAGEVGQAVPAAVFLAALLFVAAAWDAAGTAALVRYARAHGLAMQRSRFPRFLAMPGPPRRLGAYPNGCRTVLTGRIAGGRSGILVVEFPNEVRGRYAVPSTCLPVACFDLTAVAGELAAWSFAVRTLEGRVTLDPVDDPAAGRLLDTGFGAWLGTSGGVSFEVSNGWLFVIDDRCRTPSAEGLDALSDAAARTVKRVFGVAAAPG